MNKNIFINKNLIICNNFHKTAKLIKSPFSDGFGIWIPNARIHKSKFDKYISIYLETDKPYKAFKYQNCKIIETKEFQGKNLINGYQNQKYANSFKFINQKSKLNKNNDFVPKNEIIMSKQEINKILNEIDNL